MSLLDRAKQDIIIYHQVEVVSDDGNIMIRASGVGVPAKAEIQAARQSGTSARRAEQDNEGFETEEVYRLRFTRSYLKSNPALGPAAEVEWRGARWSVVGMPTYYMGSSRTAHVDFQIRRT